MHIGREIYLQTDNRAEIIMIQPVISHICVHNTDIGIGMLNTHKPKCGAVVTSVEEEGNIYYVFALRNKNTFLWLFWKFLAVVS